jgi:hypothetical protein
LSKFEAPTLIVLATIRKLLETALAYSWHRAVGQRQARSLDRQYPYFFQGFDGAAALCACGDPDCGILFIG